MSIITVQSIVCAKSSIQVTNKNDEMSLILKSIMSLTLSLISLFFAGFCHAQNAKWNVQDIELSKNWQIQSSAKISATAQSISSEDFKVENWLPAVVPGSILGSLVADSMYKNIFFGRNLEKIPSAQFEVPWWYRTNFHVENLQPGYVARLQFNGINYRAEIWLNGHMVASSDTVKGGYCRFNINITDEIKHGNNILAVKVFRPQPGEPTLGFVDWNPPPPDNNMGIWRNVTLRMSGPVTIDQSFVQTDVDTSTLAHADLTIKSVLYNYSNLPITGDLKGSVGKISFLKKVTIPPNSFKEVVFTPLEYTQLSIHNPRLWWVHTLGKPELHDLDLRFVTGKKVSDVEKTRFGIRSVSDYITVDGHRGYKLNGKKILIKGGGWTDPMLLNATPEYEQAGIDYAVHMNLNTIRMENFWGNNEHLYNLCDEKGILIMVGWSAHWEWENYFGAPVDSFGGIKTQGQMNVVARSWKDQIVWLRNHPSIFVWVYGSDKLPRPELEGRYLEIHRQYDPTRPYVAAAQEHTSSLTGPSRMKMRGPYDYVPPLYWYVDTANGGAFGFNTETGPGPQVPVLESLKKMIPPDSLWPISDPWKFHSARGEFNDLQNYNNAMDHRLRKPNDLADYLRKAQFLNYEGMRSMFEAFESNRFKATGIIQWMFNSSWPKLWWQLYDYYLMPTGAFYGARIANEPLHISYNYGEEAVYVMNNTSKKTNKLTSEINILDFNLKSILKKTIPVSDLASQETKSIFTLPDNINVSKTFFLNLRLFNQKNDLISTNFYVLSTQKDSLGQKKTNWYITPQSQYADLTLLEKLPKVKLQTSETVSQKGENTIINVKVKNPSQHVAFMVYMDLKKGQSNESVVPVFWKENYFTLLPGEKRTVSVTVHTTDMDGQKGRVVVGGWNVE